MAGEEGQTVDGPEGRSLWQRADRVVPGGGIYLTRSARFAGTGTQPGFVVAGEGCRVTDVDGRSYIDFLCANGPILLGYRHPEVEATAREQASRAVAVSYYPPVLIELCERLVGRHAGMEWAVAMKNGTDAVSLGVRVARAATNRDLVIVFRRAYHGFDPLFVPGGTGVPQAVRDSVLHVGWNDGDELEQTARRCGDQLAAIVLNPLDQYPLRDTVEPSPEFCTAIRKVCERTGALLVFDDVRNGFRQHPEGSWVPLDLEPDLVCLGKGLGNGYAVSALLGRESVRGAASSLMFTASHAFEAVALAAGVKVLEIYDRDRVWEGMWSAGERLRDGMLKAAAAAGHRVRWSGPPTMPTLLFEDDPDQSLGRAFSLEAARRGALFHPRLNWFLSAAHDEPAIDEAVSIAAEAFRETPPP